jgi:hypothetical protein
MYCGFHLGIAHLSSKFSGFFPFVWMVPSQSSQYWLPLLLREKRAARRKGSEKGLGM